MLSVRDLSVTFPQREGNAVQAVRGISYDVYPGEFLGIVGESGSGKSVSSLAVMGLLPSTAQITGAIEFEGQSLLGLDDNRLSKIRGKDLAMVSRSPKHCGCMIRTCRRAPRLPAPSSCSRSSGFPMPSVVRRRSRTNTRAACASAP